MEFNEEKEDEKFLNYLEGNLEQDETHEFEKSLFGDEESHKRLDEYQTVLEGMENAPEFSPSKALTEQFFETLKREKNKEEKNPVRKIRSLWQGSPWMQVAAAVLLFFVGYFVDKRISIDDMRNQEIADLREEISTTKHMIMLSMLNQQSASKRIQAVNYTYDLAEADEKLLEALLHTMNFDSNLNVRMAATEALYRFANDENVRLAMISSLKKEKNPEMQIMLIDMLVELKEQKALGVIQDLARQENLMKIVKAKANEGIEVLL